MKKKYPSSLTNVLKKRFPNFSKICLCYANNPLYGMDISPEAKDWLNRTYFEKYAIDRSELTSEQAKQVQFYLENNFSTIKSLIIWMALNDETTVQKRLSTEDCGVQVNLPRLETISGVEGRAGEGKTKEIQR